MAKYSNKEALSYLWIYGLSYIDEYFIDTEEIKKYAYGITMSDADTGYDLTYSDGYGMHLIDHLGQVIHKNVSEEILKDSPVNKELVPTTYAVLSYFNPFVADTVNDVTIDNNSIVSLDGSRRIAKIPNASNNIRGAVKIGVELFDAFDGAKGNRIESNFLDINTSDSRVKLSEFSKYSRASYTLMEEGNSNYFSYMDIYKIKTDSKYAYDKVISHTYIDPSKIAYAGPTKDYTITGYNSGVQTIPVVSFSYDANGHLYKLFPRTLTIGIPKPGTDGTVPLERKISDSYNLYRDLTSKELADDLASHLIHSIGGVYGDIDLESSHTDDGYINLNIDYTTNKLSANMVGINNYKVKGITETKLHGVDFGLDANHAAYLNINAYDGITNKIGDVGGDLFMTGYAFTYFLSDKVSSYSYNEFENEPFVITYISQNNGKVTSVGVQNTEYGKMHIVETGSAEAAKVYKIYQGPTSDDKYLIGTIDIPKDSVIKSATIGTCTEKDKPISGLLPGDNYFDFEITTSSGSTHLYIPVKSIFGPNNVDNITIKYDSGLIKGKLGDITDLSYSGTGESIISNGDGLISGKKIYNAIDTASSYGVSLTKDTNSIGISVLPGTLNSNSVILGSTIIQAIDNNAPGGLVLNTPKNSHDTVYIGTTKDWASRKYNSSDNNFVTFGDAYGMIKSELKFIDNASYGVSISKVPNSGAYLSLSLGEIKNNDYRFITGDEAYNFITTTPNANGISLSNINGLMINEIPSTTISDNSKNLVLSKDIYNFPDTSTSQYGISLSIDNTGKLKLLFAPSTDISVDSYNFTTAQAVRNYLSNQYIPKAGGNCDGVITFTSNTAGIKFNGLSYIGGLDPTLEVKNNKLGVANNISGSTTVNSIVNIPITHAAVLANTSTGGALSFTGMPTDGCNVHVIVKNNSSSTISITLPNSGNYHCTSTSTIDIAANGYAEVNILAIDGQGYIKGVGIENS